MIAVFARKEGYARPKNGYSILLVRCVNLDEVNKLRVFLAANTISGLAKSDHNYRKGYLGINYGGKFDYIAHFNAEMPDVWEMYNYTDATYVGLFNATDIFNADKQRYASYD